MIYFREKITRSNRLRQIANVSQRGIEVEPITPTEMLTSSNTLSLSLSHTHTHTHTHKSNLPRDYDNKIPKNKNLYSLVLIYVMQIWFFQGDRSKVPPDLNEQLQGNY
jgi:hypothetical protein